jgi:hypothetical protein
MEKRYLYRWTFTRDDYTISGTRERLFTSRKAFEDCLRFWNEYQPDGWLYEEVSEPDPDRHEIDSDTVWQGPFQFYGI